MKLKEISNQEIIRLNNGIYNFDISHFVNKFFYISKNSDNEILIHKSELGHSENEYYKIIDISETEFKMLKELAKKNIYDILSNYQLENLRIISNSDIEIFQEFSILIKPNMNNQYAIYRYNLNNNNLSCIYKTNLYKLLLDGVINKNIDYTQKKNNSFNKVESIFNILDKDILNYIRNLKYNDDIYMLRYYKNIIKAYQDLLKDIQKIDGY